MSPKQLAIVFLILTSAMWGLTAVLGKIALTEASPFFILGTRFLAASIAIFAFLTISGKVKQLVLKKRHLLGALSIGFIGSFIGLSIYYYGLRYTSAINTAFILRTYPLFALLLAIIFLRERLSKFGIVGIGTMILGGFLLMYSPELTLGLRGDLLILVSALLWGTTSVIAKSLLKTVSPWAITFYRATVAAVFGILASLLFGQVTIALSAKVWLAIILSGIVCGFFGFLFFYKGLQLIKASEASSITSFAPLFTIVYAFLFLAEIPSITQLLGGLLIVTGLIIISKKWTSKSKSFS